MNYCLIPARSGSKRIKNKNIKNFFGKPVISYSIKTALRSKLFDKVFVSTDSRKVADISKKFGAEIPFLRPKKISDDYATDSDVINHFLKYLKKNKMIINSLCYIYPVNPLLQISTLKKCKKLLEESNSKKVVTVGKFSHPIDRALKLDKNRFVNFRNKKYKKQRSQDLGTYYHDAAQCYWINLKKKTNNKTKALVLKKFQFLDVDDIEDFTNLEKIYQSKLHAQ